MRSDTAWQATLAEISTRHQDTLDELTRTAGTTPTITSRFATAQAALAADIQRMRATPFATEEARGHAVAAYSGWGERLAVLLFAQALAGEGVAAAPFAGEPVALVARPGLAEYAPIGDIGEPRHERADFSLARLAPSVAATRELLAPHVADWQAAELIPVLPGYLGGTRDGLVTTLGRNGSDYSAAVIAAALHAEAVYLYSTVAGVNRADPHVVPEADVLPALTYADAAEAAALGARVLHPATLRPLAAAGIPLRLRNTLSPEDAGTDVGGVGHVLAADLESSGWVVTARTLPSERALRETQPAGELGLVEVTGLFFRHAEWETREDDHLCATADEPSETGGNSMGGGNDGPVSGALALLTAPPLPVSLAVSARRISVTVPAAESAATRALAHAEARAGHYCAVTPPTERRRTS